ncbi:alpha/beta fold hydrolase [Paenibacillus sp. DYY-L-2]|uniref:alpha/beta fold hydrolase n=1 Tax=Paenibacillus sp. DYY-L-2 TaxID=3447013 RepID=UPI003F50246F
MNKQSSEKIGFVFVHGAGLKGQIWSNVVEGFDYPCLLAEFPQREGSFDARSGLSLEDYVTYLKRQIDEWGTHKIVIVAHSLGGVLAPRLASLLSDRLAGVIAVGAAIPKNGGSFLSALPFPQRLLMSLIMRAAGTKPPESSLRTGLCNDLSPDQTAEIIKGFTPEAVRVYTDRIDVPVPDVPKLYVKLNKDQEFSQTLQEKMIANFAPQTVRSLDTGHLPMISNPEGLKSILEEFAAEKLR